MKPVRVQLSRKKGWRMPENTVKVDRATKWGNPFEGEPGLAVALFRKHLHEEFVWCPIPAKKWPRGKIPAKFTSVTDVRRELAGKNLACWCALDQPCHADVLLAIANEPLPGGQYYAKQADGHMMLCNADGTRSIFDDVDE